MTDSTMGGRSATGGRGAWRRDFTLLWSASAMTQFGSVNSMFAAPLLALALTGSPVFAGWVTAAGTLPRILFALPVGALVDRLDRRRVMIVSLAVRGALAMMLTAGVLVAMPERVLLPLIAFAQGICLVFFSTAETTVVPRIVPRDHLPTATGRFEARVHAAALLGRPLGGLLFDLHHALVFAIDAVASLVSVAVVLRTAKEHVKPPAVRSPLRMATLFGDMKDGLAFLRRERFLLRVLGICALANFFFQVFGLVLILLAHQENLPSLLIGCLVAATGLGGVLGSVTASRLQRHAGAPEVIVVCMWSWLALTTAVAVFDENSLLYAAAVLPLAWAGIGFTGAHINVALAVYQADTVPKKMLGRVTGAARFLSGGAVPLGAPAGGYVIAELGTENAIDMVAWAIGVLTICLSLLIASPRGRVGRARVALVRRIARWWASFRQPRLAGTHLRLAPGVFAEEFPQPPRQERSHSILTARN